MICFSRVLTITGDESPIHVEAELVAVDEIPHGHTDRRFWKALSRQLIEDPIRRARTLGLAYDGEDLLLGLMEIVIGVHEMQPPRDRWRRVRTLLFDGSSSAS